jgi:hypothetical protein
MISLAIDHKEDKYLTNYEFNTSCQKDGYYLVPNLVLLLALFLSNWIKFLLSL